MFLKTPCSKRLVSVTQRLRLSFRSNPSTWPNGRVGFSNSIYVNSRPFSYQTVSFFFFFLRDPHPSAPFTGGSSSPSARSSTPPPLCSSAGTSVFPSVRQPYRHRTSSLKTHYVDVFFPSLLSRALLGVDGSRRISRRSSARQDRLRVGRESFFA